MVSWPDFERVQALLTRGKTNTPKAFRHTFTYRGMIFCGSCGALVTAEYTTNRFGTRYTYYRCCRKNKQYGYCAERSIQEKGLEAHIQQTLGDIAMPGPVYELVSSYLPKLEAELLATERTSTARLAELVSEKNKQLERLRELCAKAIITDEELRQDRERLMADIRRLEEDISAARSPAGLIQPWTDAFSHVNRALSAFQKAGPEERRSIVRDVSSNLILKARNLHVELHPEIALLCRAGTCPTSR